MNDLAINKLHTVLSIITILTLSLFLTHGRITFLKIVLQVQYQMLFPRFKGGLAQVRAGGAPKGIPQSALAAARRLDGLLCSCLLVCWLAAGSGVGPPARAIRTGFPSSAIIVPFCCGRNALHVGRERAFLLVQQVVFVNHVVVVLQRNGHGSVRGAVLLFVVLELHRRREHGLRSCRRLVRRQDAHSNSAGFCCFFALRGALTARQQKGRVNGLQETVLVRLVVVVASSSSSTRMTTRLRKGIAARSMGLDQTVESSDALTQIVSDSIVVVLLLVVVSLGAASWSVAAVTPPSDPEAAAAAAQLPR